jgi:hypothetical protein
MTDDRAALLERLRMFLEGAGQQLREPCTPNDRAAARLMVQKATEALAALSTPACVLHDDDGGPAAG